MLVPVTEPAPTDPYGIQSDLRRVGLRATAARMAILAALRSAGGPVSHGEMAGLMRRRSWNRTTVYRNLLDLARSGLARRFDVGDHVWRFEARSEPGRDEHPHFVCNTCGDIECLEGIELAVELSAAAPRAVLDQQVEIQVHGVCDRCL